MPPPGLDRERCWLPSDIQLYYNIIVLDRWPYVKRYFRTLPSRTYRFLYWYNDGFNWRHILANVVGHLLLFLAFYAVWKLTYFDRVFNFMFYWCFQCEAVLLWTIISFLYAEYTLPFFTAIVLFLGIAHFHLKEYCEFWEMVESYVDKQPDPDIDFWELKYPVYLKDLRWAGGHFSEDYERVVDFVAPTVYAKVYGMWGRVGTMELKRIELRIHHALAERLSRDRMDGPYPWHRICTDAQHSLVFIHFKTIADATRAFHSMDGTIYDLRDCFVRFVTEQRFNYLFGSLQETEPVGQSDDVQQ